MLIVRPASAQLLFGQIKGELFIAMGRSGEQHCSPPELIN